MLHVYLQARLRIWTWYVYRKAIPATSQGGTWTLDCWIVSPTCSPLIYTSPKEKYFLHKKTHPADCILSLILATRKSPFSSCWTQERNMRGIEGGTQIGKGEKKKSSLVNALLFSWFRWKSYFHSKEIFSSCNKL